MYTILTLIRLYFQPEFAGLLLKPTTIVYDWELETTPRNFIIGLVNAGKFGIFNINASLEADAVPFRIQQVNVKLSKIMNVQLQLFSKEKICSWVRIKRPK